MCVTIVGVCSTCRTGFSGRTQYCYKGMDGIVCVDPMKVRRRMVGPINTTTMDGTYINMLGITRTETFSGLCNTCKPGSPNKISKKRKTRE
jgi:hypothetical protein